MREAIRTIFAKATIQSFVVVLFSVVVCVLAVRGDLEPATFIGLVLVALNWAFPRTPAPAGKG